ncbi:MAG: response regulator [Acidobacteria bacterium]|jgi:putative two-component system response regulator|nr:response regulator [Acidobacteriota bacterium]
MTADNKPARILVVDDEPGLSRLVAQLLTARGYANRICVSGAEAIAQLRSGEFDLVISDITMPGMSGIELLTAAKLEHPGIAFIMLTAIDDHATAVRALELGAFGYIVKPFEANELFINISNALRRRELELERDRYEERLEDEVRERTAEIRAAQEQVILRLMSASGYRDEETGDHIRRMGEYAAVLARAAGWDAGATDEMRLAAPMHDIGKIGVADAILHKAGKLTPGEFAQIQEHSRIGFRILEGSGIPLLDLAGEIALHHHEKWDGSGYPDGLAGESIPEAARIVAICDVYDALVTDRVYRRAFSEEQALAIMSEGRGGHFDPRLFDIFLAKLPELREVRARFAP